MDNLIITVNHTHFKGNGYHHGQGDRGICPLSMAYEDQMGHRAFVGGSTVRDVAHGKILYDIPSSWTDRYVEKYIDMANKGEEFTVDVQLTPK